MEVHVSIFKEVKSKKKTNTQSITDSPEKFWYVMCYYRHLYQGILFLITIFI